MRLCITFLNNFENVVNRRLNIREDIKCYQDTLSYVLSKVDCSVGEGIYMMPSNMNLKIRSGTAGYNSEILVSDSGFSLGRNAMVNALKLEEEGPKLSHKVVLQPTITHNLAQKPTAINHEKEKLPWYFLWLLPSEYGMLFDKINKTHVRVLC